MSAKSCRKSLRSALMIAALAVPMPAFAAFRAYLGPDGGNWSTPGNWSGGVVPANGDDVSINPGAGDRNVNMDVPYASPGISSLLVDGLNFSTGTVTQSFATMTVSGSEYVGYNGRGRYVHSGGTHTVGGQGLFIGLSAGSSGSYDLSGGATLNVNANSSMTTTVGGAGNGVFNQSGGTHNVYRLEVGARFNNGSGNYAFSGGSLNATVIAVGGPGNGYFTQSGGNLSVGVLSIDPGGSYNFTEGNFTVTSLLVNNANFNQAHSIFSATITNNGSYSMTGGGLIVNAGGFLNNATVNLSSGNITLNGPLTNNSQILFYGNPSIFGAAQFNNLGLLSEGSGVLTISAPTNNSGSINLAAGGGINLNGAILTNTGAINLGSGRISGAGAANLVNRFGATVTGAGLISSPFDNQGGRLLLTDGTTLITNAFNNSGIIQLTDDAASLTGGAITNSGEIIGHGSIGNTVSALAGGMIEASGGTLILGGGVSNVANATLSATAGSKLLLPNGLGNNGGLINLSGGYFDNSTIALNNTGQISGFGTFRTGGLTNNGSVTLTGGFSTVMGNVTNAATRQIKVAYDPTLFTGNVTNNGIFKSTSTTVTFAGTYTENGTFISDPADNYFNDVNIAPAGAWIGGKGGRFLVSGDFINQSANSTQWDTVEAELHLITGAGDIFAVNGKDLGIDFVGYNDNFAWGTLSLAAGRSLTLTDADAAPGGAVYVDHLDLQGGIDQISDITGNGIKLYYSLANPNNAYLQGKSYQLAGGGSISPVPEPAGVLLGFIATSFLFAQRNRWRKA